MSKEDDGNEAEEKVLSHRACHTNGPWWVLSNWAYGSVASHVSIASLIEYVFTFILLCIKHFSTFLSYCRAANHERTKPKKWKENRMEYKRVCFSSSLSLVCSRIAYFSSSRILSTMCSTHTTHPYHCLVSSLLRFFPERTEYICIFLIGNWICFISNCRFVSESDAPHAIPISRGCDLVSVLLVLAMRLFVVRMRECLHI